MRTRFNREISPASMEIALGGQSSAFASNLMSAALALPFSGTARTLAQSQDASLHHARCRQCPPSLIEASGVSTKAPPPHQVAKGCQRTAERRVGNEWVRKVKTRGAA